MHLITFINFADRNLLDTGYTMKDQLASTVSRYLALSKIPYVSPFACIGIVLDNQRVSSTHPLNAFGDTPLVLKPDLVEELQISCKADIQNAASNGLRFWNRNRRMAPHLKIVDMRDMQNKSEFVHKLALASGETNYPEARIYRGLTWADLDDECARRLKHKYSDIEC